jgi:hypothetical protein
MGEAERSGRSVDQYAQPEGLAESTCNLNGKMWLITRWGEAST